MNYKTGIFAVCTLSVLSCVCGWAQSPPSVLPAGTGGPPRSNPLEVALLKWYGANTTTSFAVGTNPRGVCFDGANIWVANYGSNTVTKMAANDGTVLGTFNVGTAPANVAFDGANIWVTNFGSSNVTKLRASDGTMLGTFAVGIEPFGIAFDGANIWVGDTVGSTGVVTKLRASDGKSLGNFPINSAGFCVMFDGTYIWAGNNLGTVTRLKLDGTNAGVFSLGAAGDPYGLAFDGQNVWVADQQAQGILVKLRASDGALLASIDVGAGPYGVAFDGTYIWLTGGTYLAQIEPQNGKVLRSFSTPGNSTGIAFDGADLWITGYDGNIVLKM